MTGLDTNILVRFLAQDDADQCRKVDLLLQTLSSEALGFVSLVCLTEFVWVMRSYYRMPKAQLIDGIEQLLNSPELLLEDYETVIGALRRFASVKADFADCLIERAGHAAGCAKTVTFDVKAARASGMTLL